MEFSNFIETYKLQLEVATMKFMVHPYGISCLHILARTDAISVRAKQSSRVVNSRAIQFIVDSKCHAAICKPVAPCTSNESQEAKLLLVYRGGKPTSSENAKTRKQRQAFELPDYLLFGVMCWGNLLTLRSYCLWFSISLAPGRFCCVRRFLL